MTARVESSAAGFRAGGLEAWLQLVRRTVDLLERGRGVPCVADPLPFTSDDLDQRRAAAAACFACPALVECARFAVLNHEACWVWAGIDLTPSQGRRVAASRAELRDRAGLSSADQRSSEGVA